MTDLRLTPAATPFLGARDTRTPGAIVLGAPLDRTESFRPGTYAAPDRIRQVSDVLETYSPTVDADLVELSLADWGNLDIGPAAGALSMDAALAAVGEAVTVARQVGLPILLGGEHTATLGAVQALAGRYPGLVVVHVDAHTDLRATYSGEHLSHATVMRRVAEVVGFEHLAQYGIRSGTRDEFVLARRCLTCGPDLVMTRVVRDRIHTRPVYLSIDIDVLDPSVAPGTGCPEPGGASFAELMAFLAALRTLNVVAVDVMEVLPAADSNDITSVAAAKLVREAALLFGRRRPTTG